MNKQDKSTKLAQLIHRLEKAKELKSKASEFWRNMESADNKRVLNHPLYEVRKKEHNNKTQFAPNVSPLHSSQSEEFETQRLVRILLEQLYEDDINSLKEEIYSLILS
jgi:hypothetical protein